MFRILIILFIFIWKNSDLHAQSILRSFSGRQINLDVIEIAWITKAGNTCSDLRIERSMDEDAFNEVFRFNGICGVADAEQYYTFFDTVSLSGNYAYRINENNGVYSDTINIRVFVDGFEIIAFPNPASENFALRTKIENTNEFMVSIYALDGKIAREKSTVKPGDWISISSLSSGLYTVWVDTNDRFYYLLLVKN